MAAASGDGSVSDYTETDSEAGSELYSPPSFPPRSTFEFEDDGEEWKGITPEEPTPRTEPDTPFENMFTRFL